jgi:predicted RNase H-like HicB family nuclease
MKYTIIIEKGRESGYVAYAPALKGCVSQGKTKAEALKNIKEAMEAYVEALGKEENLREDILDIAVIQRRKKETSRPFREYLTSR